MDIKTSLKQLTERFENAGIPRGRIDAEVLLCKSLGKDRTFLYSNPEYFLSAKENSRLSKYAKRRANHEPIAYIVGHKEFYGHSFFVNKNVLIPRPETEWLVEQGIKYLASSSEKKIEPLRVVDIGTGSGNIIISIALDLSTNRLIKKSVLYGAEIDKKAIEVAKKNARTLGAKNVNFYISDLFANKRLPDKFNLILANLPYVPSSTRIKNPESRNMAGEIDFEPQRAIFAGSNGTSTIKRFLKEAKEFLEKNGLILLELDPRNAEELFKCSKEFYPSARIKLEKDLSGLDRYLFILNKKPTD